MRTLALIFMYLMGAALIVSGLTLVYVPLALVVAGAGVVRAAFVLDAPADSGSL
jgi:hypothetical protein